MRSESPPAYASAVLKKLIPASIDLATISVARFWSTLDTAAIAPRPEPKVMAPNAKRETIRPELPSRVYCMGALRIAPLVEVKQQRRLSRVLDAMRFTAGAIHH